MRTHIVGPLVLAGVLAIVAVGSAAITTQPVGDTLTPEALVSQILGDASGVTVSNVTIRGCPAGLGTFSGGTGIVGFESGILLSSGDIGTVVGPNQSTGAGTNCGVPGDDDLNALLPTPTDGSPPPTTNDAAVLEFDFVPTSGMVAFQYVFASEEYNEYVGSQFNDVFAFFVNGTNYATIPGTTLPVAVNNVNDGNPDQGVPASNPLLFIDNTNGILDTEADGLTQVLSFTAPVNAGQTNHIKLAIADTGDSILDSWIFIGAKSLSSTPADVAVQVKGTTPVLDCNIGGTGKGLGTCEAEGFALVPGTSGALATSAAAIGTPTGLTAVTKSIKRKFNKSGHAKIKLKLNATGKKLLKSSGQLQVLVVVNVTDKQGQSVQFQRLINLLKHLK